MKMGPFINGAHADGFWGLKDFNDLSAESLGSAANHYAPLFRSIVS